MSTNGKPLSKEQLLGLQANETITRNVNGWGNVRLRTMSGLDRAELERLSTGKLDPAKWRQKLLSLSLANEDGTRMFDDNEAKLLLEKPGIAVEDLCNEILQLNQIGGDAVDEAKKN